MSDKRFTASPGYAYGQFERALDSADGKPAKIEQWRAVVAGMADGTLTVGSRTPVADTPAWVTLEVAHGGFATGRYLAEVELRDDELAVLPADAPGTTPGSGSTSGTSPTPARPSCSPRSPPATTGSTSPRTAR